MKEFSKVIYMDFDNTLGKAEKRLVELWNDFYRLPNEQPVDWREITTWDCGIPKDDVDTIFSRIVFYHPSKFELYDGVRETLKTLRDMGYKIIIYSKGTLMNIASKTIYTESKLYDVIDGHVFIGSKNVKMGKGMLDMTGGIIVDDHQDNLKNNNASYNICAKLTENEVEWNEDFKVERYIIRKFPDLINVVKMIVDYHK